MACCFYYILCFFFKQKTAYEVRISGGSSDVCSSDLVADLNRGEGQMAPGEVAMPLRTQFSAPGRKERAGLGVVPTRLFDCGPLWKRPIDSAALYWRLESFHRPYRSEEHTSELQSLMRSSYAVFCLKKKKKEQNINKENNKNKDKIKKRK